MSILFCLNKMKKKIGIHACYMCSPLKVNRNKNFQRILENVRIYANWEEHCHGNDRCEKKLWKSVFLSFPSNIYWILISLRLFFSIQFEQVLLLCFFFIHFHVNCNEPCWCNSPTFLSRLKCVLWKLKKHWHRCSSRWKYSLPKNLYHSLACTIHVNNDDNFFVNI